VSLTKYPATRTCTFPSGHVAVLTRASPRAAAVASVDLLAALGPTIAGVIGGGGVRLSDQRVIPLGEILRAALELAESDAEADRKAAALQVVTEVGGALLGAARILEGQRLLAIAELLIVGNCTIAPPGGAHAQVSSVEVLDALLPDGWTLILLAHAAFRLNVGPTFAGAGGDPAPAGA
jgi:hypothetical protein